MRRPGAPALLALLALLAAPAGAASSAPWLDRSTAATAADLAERAQQIRRLHLATLGLEAALSGTQNRIDQVAADRVQAEIRLEEAADRVRSLRRALSGAAGRTVAALRLAGESGATTEVSYRRAALRAGSIDWSRSEQALREADRALAQLGQARVEGEATMAALDGLMAQLGQERARIEEVPLAVLAMELRQPGAAAPLPAAVLPAAPLPAEALLRPALPHTPPADGAADGAAALALADLPPGRAGGLPWSLPRGDEPAWDGIPARLPVLPPPARGAARRGILLDPPPSGTILAPEAGKIVFAGAFRSYGQILIIDHGNGYHTLMAGFARLGVAAGAEVLAGERIGTVDAGSGVSGRLYVELRRKGVPVDPMPWLAAREDKVRG
ncbi:murein hydrolase activator EnvC family protein [Geminicoccus flavidas]|uniref:murein hydrolase activator EnvC family protein n=1 Tax=Geminicoccus flavidas TaxID=2506407 RepID=UPI0013593034|nr:peptidoglycan DD-metalloendopeptidase family protein [Geminicoccus flavidas]